MQNTFCIFACALHSHICITYANQRSSRESVGNTQRIPSQTQADCNQALKTRDSTSCCCQEVHWPIRGPLLVSSKLGTCKGDTHKMWQSLMQPYQCVTLRYRTDTEKKTGEKKLWNKMCFMVSVTEKYKWLCTLWLNIQKKEDVLTGYLLKPDRKSKGELWELSIALLHFVLETEVWKQRLLLPQVLRRSF